MKKFKRSLSLLLVLCMVLSFVPVNAFATEVTDPTEISDVAEAEEFLAEGDETDSDDLQYKIVHLDVARKYFSPTEIMDFIDKIAELGFNQLELYLGDNQGFRLMLDEPEFTVGDKTYNLDQGIVNSGYVQDDPHVTGYFRPSQEYEKDIKYYLTEAEMTEIVKYAAAKGVEIVPAINMPGHMGAILQNMPDEWHYSNNGTLSASSLNLDNAEAVAFTKALLSKYVAYFEGIKDDNEKQLIKHFSIGADEYGYDIGMKAGNILNTDLHGKIATFMNECATIINDANMTPRAFNEFFTATSNQDTAFEVYFWSGTADQLNAIQSKYAIINTSDTCYYVVGKLDNGNDPWYSESACNSGTSAFNPAYFTDRSNAHVTEANPNGTPITNLAGAMMCIWCDRGYYDDTNSTDGGASVVDNTNLNTYLTQYAQQLKKYKDSLKETVEGAYYLTVSDTTKETTTLDDVTWNVAADEVTVATNDANVATIATKVISAGSAGGAEATSQQVAIEGSTSVYIKSGDYYLAYNNGLVAVTAVEDATKWTFTDGHISAENKTIISGQWPCYVYFDGTTVSTHYSAGNQTCTYDETNGFVMTYQGKSYALAYVNGAWGLSEILAATDPVTGVTVTAVGAGQTTVTVTVGETTNTYTIIVEEEEQAPDVPTVDRPTITYECGGTVHAGGIATCTHGKYCVYCGVMYDKTVDKTVHLNEGTETSDTVEDPTDTVHYLADVVCTGCGTLIQDSGSEEHKGGTATCVARAVCSVCGTEYGSVDSTNHVGNTGNPSFTSATTESAGTTGSYTCACGVGLYGDDGIGITLPKFEEDGWEDIVVYVGKTYTLNVEGAYNTITGVTNTNNLETDKVTLKSDFYEGVQGSSETKTLTAFPTDGSGFHITDGNGHYYSIVDGAVANTDANSASVWYVDASNNLYTYDSNGATQYIYWWGNSGMLTYSIAYGTPWSYDNTNGLQMTSNGVNSNLNVPFVYDDGWKFSSDAGTKAILKSVPIQAENATLTVTLTGLSEGTEPVAGNGGSFTANGTNYRVTVLEPPLATQTIDIWYFITNCTVEADPTADPASGLDPYFEYGTRPRKFTVTAADTGYNEDTAAVDSVHSEAGIAIDEIGNPKPEGSNVEGTVTNNVFPYYGVNRDGKNVAYGYSMMLPAGAMQLDWHDQNAYDYSTSGTRMYYIRFWEGQWQVAGIDRTDWKTVNNGDVAEEKNNLIAYYLQETKVTDEVIVTTYVQDWGYVPHSDNLGKYTNWVLLDFAVKYDGGARDPELDEFPQANKTVLYHAETGTSDPDLVTVDADGTRTREIRMIEGLETGAYEVYMVTIKANSNDPSETLNTTTAASGYQYDGTEYVVWLESEDTVYDTENIKVHPDDFVDEDGDGVDDNGVTDGYYAIKYGDETWGNPSFDGVKIYNHQAMLVTYYVRPVHQQSNLHVFYRVDDNAEIAGDPIDGTPIYDYEIVPKDGVTFDPRFAANASTSTGLEYNTVENIAGFTRTVTSKLQDMAEVPAKYRIDYNFTQKIKYGYVSNTIDGEYVYAYVDSADDVPENKDIVHVVLYYNVASSLHYIPVDFGSPLEIDGDLFHFDRESETTKITVNSVSLDESFSNSNLKYGEVTAKAGETNTYSYVLNEVMESYETPITFALSITVTTYDEDGNVSGTPHDETVRHSVIFVPATTVYYEESFVEKKGDAASWGGTTDYSGTTVTENQETACYTKQKNNYGYDPRYSDQGIGASNGTDITTSDDQVYGEFTFTGTGVEIYANCTTESGRAFVTIMKNGSIVKMYLVDTMMKDGEVTGGQAIDQAVSAYNVPIVSQIDGLEHGQYTVRISYIHVNNPENKEIESDRGPISIDGFRVYGTLLDSDKLPSEEGKTMTAGNVYAGKKENNPQFVEMRNIVLATVGIPTGYAGDYQGEQLGTIVSKQVCDLTNANSFGGIILYGNAYGTATNGKIGGDEITVDLIDNGPKNEIYLFPDQSLIFGLTTGEAQLGLKALNGAVTYTLNSESKTLTTSTDMYYPITAVEGDGSNYRVTITNTSKNILSITKLKVIPNGTSTSFESELTESDIYNAMIDLGYIQSDSYNEDVPDEPTDATDPSENPTEATDPTEETQPEESKPDETQPEESKPVNPFVDVFESDYFYDPVLWAYGEEITTGKDATHFAPNDNCTRAEIVTFLWRAVGSPEPETTFSKFKDVKSGAYYYKAVLWATEQGITTGTSASQFSPDVTATRAQVATFLWRAVGKPEATADATQFTDVVSGSYYADAVAWAAENEITKGVDAQHFAPNDTCKRGQIATFLFRTFEQ